MGTITGISVLIIIILSLLRNNFQLRKQIKALPSNTDINLAKAIKSGSLTLDEIKELDIYKKDEIVSNETLVDLQSYYDKLLKFTNKCIKNINFIITPEFRKELLTIYPEKNIQINSKIEKTMNDWFLYYSQFGSTDRLEWINNGRTIRYNEWLGIREICKNELRKINKLLEKQ